MRPFNLAEARILERNYCQEHIGKRLKIIGLMVVLTIVVAGASFVCRTMFSGQIEQTKSRLADVQGSHVRIKREMSIINTKLNERKWQDQLTGDSNRWLGILDSAVGSVPSDVWLDSIKNSAKESNLAIAGRAASFDAVTAFITSLRCRSPFGEVRLESAKVDGSGTSTCVAFILAVTLKDATGNTSESGAPANAAPTTAQPAAAPAASEPAVTPGRVPNVQGST